AIGYDLVFQSPSFSAEDHQKIKEKLFYPLVEIAQQFPETVSNRQAFYDVCVAAIGFLYNDKQLIDIAVDGPLGFKYLLRVGMSRDGFWSEGPGYHFATLHNFLLFAEMARHHGIDYYTMETAGHCLKKMFDAPLELIGPDYEFPRMRDSGGGSLLKYVDYYEAAWARYGDRRYAEMINFAHRKKGTTRKPMIFFALNPELPDTQGDIYPEASSHFDETGFCMLRDTVGNDRKYLYLDYGIVGGEHGHPDRLSIGYYAFRRHWLVDPKNESYALPNLQTWYRQTVAHDTIVVNESKQAWTNGKYRFFGETPGLKVASGSADHLYGGVQLTRTLLMAGSYFLDLFDAKALEPRTYDLPYHSFGTLSLKDVELEKQPIDLFGHPPGVQGYDQFAEIQKGETERGWTADFRREDGDGLVLFVHGEPGTTVFRAMTPGKSTAYDKRLPMVMIRRKAPATRFECLLEAYRGEPTVKGLGRIGGRTGYTVSLATEIHTFGVDVERSRFSVIKRGKDGGELRQFSAFRLPSLSDASGELFRADFPLDFLDVRMEGGVATVTAPSDFGRLRIHGPDLKKVVVNGKETPFARDGKHCVLTQERKGLVVRCLEPEGRKIFLGMNNTVRLHVTNFSPKEVEVEVGLRLPERWEESVQAQLDYWGGIVNLVATNKTDVRTVLFGARGADAGQENRTGRLRHNRVRPRPEEHRRRGLPVRNPPRLPVESPRRNPRDGRDVHPRTPGARDGGPHPSERPEGRAGRNPEEPYGEASFCRHGDLPHGMVDGEGGDACGDHDSPPRIGPPQDSSTVDGISPGGTALSRQSFRGMRGFHRRDPQRFLYRILPLGEPPALPREFRRVEPVHADDDR
ncbi:MAG: heparinase II/III domain-containing protein, partial [Planctomycetota bacterium]